MLSDRRREVVTEQECAVFKLWPNRYQVEHNSTQRVVAVDVGSVKACVFDFVDHLASRATKNFPLFSSKVRYRERLVERSFERIVVDIEGLVPPTEVSPWVQHPIAGNAWTVLENSSSKFAFQQ